MTASETQYSETLVIRIDPDMLESAKRKAESLRLDLSTFVRWCIETGIVLGDLNAFVRSRIEEKL